MVVPADTATVKNCFTEALSRGGIALRPGDSPCALRIKAANAADEWDRYVYLHLLSSSKKGQKVDCANAQRMTPERRIAAADALVIGLNARRLCNKGALVDSEASQYWLARLQEIADRLPPVWFCLLHSERLLAALGGATPPLHQLLGDERFNEVLEGYVSGATGIRARRELPGYLELPWPQVGYSAVFLPLFNKDSVAGLSRWCEFMRQTDGKPSV